MLRGSVQFFDGSLRQHRQRVAFVPQRESVDWAFPITVREVVSMGTYRGAGWWKPLGKQRQAAIDQAIADVGLTDLQQRQIGQLSGGQQQRCFLARALCKTPIVI